MSTIGTYNRCCGWGNCNLLWRRKCGGCHGLLLGLLGLLGLLSLSNSSKHTHGLVLRDHTSGNSHQNLLHCLIRDSRLGLESLGSRYNWWRRETSWRGRRSYSLGIGYRCRCWRWVSLAVKWHLRKCSKQRTRIRMGCYRSGSWGGSGMLVSSSGGSEWSKHAFRGTTRRCISI
jgi:hypothetical protein